MPLDDPSGCRSVGRRIPRRRRGIRYHLAGLVAWSLDLRRRLALRYYCHAYSDLCRRDPHHPDLDLIAVRVLELWRPEDELDV